MFPSCATLPMSPFATRSLDLLPDGGRGIVARVVSASTDIDARFCLGMVSSCLRLRYQATLPDTVNATPAFRREI